MSLDIRIKYSQWHLNSPIEVYLVDPKTGELYIDAKYVKFKALIKVDGAFRPFDLSLPVKPALRALGSLPAKAKNCKMLRVVLQKEKRGKLVLLDWQIMN